MDITMKNGIAHITRIKYLSFFFFSYVPCITRSKLEINILNRWKFIISWNSKIHTACLLCTVIHTLLVKASDILHCHLCIFVDEIFHTCNILPCICDTSNYLSDLNRGQADNFLRTWESCVLFSTLRNT